MTLVLSAPLQINNKTIRAANQGSVVKRSTLPNPAGFLPLQSFKLQTVISETERERDSVHSCHLLLLLLDRREICPEISTSDELI
ncbi:hypothetical protein AMECASPLE_028705 [Ameca splendens]|uniref:Uncharacterized protein n=1 Tax=Ameca splendens TaxID=208324 RepID=A0ABV0YGN3_9TELE